MADNLTDAIVSDAQGPHSASSDVGSMTQHRLPDLIEADKHVRATEAVGRKHRGIRFSRLAPPGAVTQPNS
jgi:hypothetical protein